MDLNLRQVLLIKLDTHMHENVFSNPKKGTVEVKTVKVISKKAHLHFISM